MRFSRVARTAIHRCPACGQRIAAAAPQSCPLCGFDFRSEQATGVDITPFAKAYTRGEPGWRRMSEWVWFAGRERLKHLALMHSSAASRRFAWTNILFAAVGLAMVEFSRVGWRWVSAIPEIEPTGSISPSGNGWLHVAAYPRPFPVGLPPESPVDLWWNPVQAIVAVAGAVVAGTLLLWLMLAVLRVGVRLAHSDAYRKEQRMTAAIHYGTAWAVPVVVGAIIAGLSPLSYVGTIQGWTWYPPQRGFVLSAAVLAGFGITMWWFWVVRLGSTAPARTRARVVAFWTLGAPLILAATAAAWWRGLTSLYDPLFEALNLRF